MPVTELNEDTHGQICYFFEYLQQIKQLKNNDIGFLFDKIVKKYV